MKEEQGVSTTTTEVPATEPRPWVTPAFERVALREALAGFSKASLDKGTKKS